MELVSLISMFYFSCAAGTFGTTSGTGITSGTGTTGELVSLLARVYLAPYVRSERWRLPEGTQKPGRLEH